MVDRMPFLADFWCANRFEIVLHGGLSEDENSYPFTLQIVWVCGAAQLDKLMWFATEMVAKRRELFM